VPTIPKRDRLTRLPPVGDTSFGELRHDVPRVPISAHGVLEAAVPHASLASKPSRHATAVPAVVGTHFQCTLGAKLFRSAYPYNERKCKYRNLLDPRGGDIATRRRR
jgi:hypothetical protein